MTGVNEQVLVFEGVLDCDAFPAFCANRARRLSLRHSVLDQSATSIRVALSGNPILIDMFEMACSLGPQGSIVTNVTRGSA